jgi:3-oxoacyl-[acyl-carrier protein] reductase
MDLGIKDKIALVLASTDGLGGAIAAALAAEGARVVVHGRDTQRAVDAARRLPAAVGIGGDLGATGAAAHVVEATRAALGDPDIVVLNGPGPTPGPSADLGPEAARVAFGLLVAPQLDVLARTIGPMRAAGWGRVLAVGSSGVQAPLPMLGASNLGRAALAAHLKTLAAEVAGDGVTVNMLLPGRIATARVAALDDAAARRQGTEASEVRAASQGRIPVGRYGDPDEFGAVAAFLCSARASYVTGSQVRCDGGLLAHL